MFDFTRKKQDILFGRKKGGGKIRATQKARGNHMHVIGATGSGKTKFLEHLIRQDIEEGRGLCLLDPHGELYKSVVHFCSQNPSTEKKLVLLDATSDDWSFGFNPLSFQNKNPLNRSFYVDGLLRATVQVSDRDLEIMNYLTKGLRSIYHVMAAHGLTICEADTLITFNDEKNIRKYLTETIDDDHQKDVWGRYDGLNQNYFDKEFQSPYGKIFRFLDCARVRNILGQTKNLLDIRKCMDEGAIVLVNLSMGKDKLSSEAGDLLGRFLINYLFKTAMARGSDDYDAPEPRPFYLYIDECHRYISEDISAILGQTRKFGLHMILAHQWLQQLDGLSDSVYHAVMGSTGIKVVFGGLSPDDSAKMADVVFRGELDLEEPKHILDKPVVYDEEIIWLDQESTSASQTKSTTESESASDSEVLDTGGQPIGDIHTHTESEGRATSYSESMSATRGRGQVLKPIRKMMPMSVYSLPEQRYKAANVLAELPEAEGITKVLNKQSIHFEVPFVEKPYTSKESVDKFVEEICRLSSCVSPTKLVEQEIKDRKERLIRDARKYKEGPEVKEPESYWGKEKVK